MDPYLENLEEEVFLKNNTVTYKWLVKHLKVASNVAKQMLYEFVMKKKTADVYVNVTYLVCGERLSEDGYMVHEVFIVPESSLESVKSKLTTISSVHIYAVHKTPLWDPSVLYSVDYDLFNGSLEERGGFYTICYPDLIFRQTKVIESEAKSAIQSENAREKALANNSSANTNTKKDNGSIPAKQSKCVLEKMFSNINKKEKVSQKKSVPDTEETTSQVKEESQLEENVKKSTVTTSNVTKMKKDVSKKRSFEEDKLYTGKETNRLLIFINNPKKKK
ncbi:DNA polymerase delta subunit 3, variant 2 [Chamberlinius hualienensis]